MTKLITLLLIFSAISVFGQANSSSKSLPKTSNPIDFNLVDTTLQVLYPTKTNSLKEPAYFINGKLVNEKFFQNINPSKIESIDIVKENIQIKDILYHGQVYIKTTKSYAPRIISLLDLKTKYTNVINKPTVFMVDDEIITSNYDKYVIDEKFIMRIIVNNIDNENLNFNLIKVLTKSEENIKKLHENIRIRGSAAMISKK